MAGLCAQSMLFGTDPYSTSTSSCDFQGRDGIVVGTQRLGDYRVHGEPATFRGPGALFALGAPKVLKTIALAEHQRPSILCEQLPRLGGLAG